MASPFYIYGVANIITDYLHIDEVIKILKAFPCFESSLSQIRKHVTIDDADYGLELLRSFHQLTFTLRIVSKDQKIKPLLDSLVGLEYLNGISVKPGQLTKLTNLTTLTIGSTSRITDATLLNLKNLTSLTLMGNHDITDRIFDYLVNLKYLTLGDGTWITEKGVFNINHRLISLSLRPSFRFIDNGLCRLTSLTSLDLEDVAWITDDKVQSLQNMTKLTSLKLGKNKVITDAGLQKLTNLTSLDLSDNRLITDNGITTLTNLTALNLDKNSRITDKSIEHLKKQLTSLDLSNNLRITNIVLRKLPNLMSLRLVNNYIITDDGIYNLKNIRSLDLAYNPQITLDGFRWLTNLKWVRITQSFLEKEFNEHLTSLKTPIQTENKLDKFRKWLASKQRSNKIFESLEEISFKTVIRANRRSGCSQIKNLIMSGIDRNGRKEPRLDA